MLMVASTSMSGGIGNHVATKTVEENYKELEIVDFLYMLISGWCSICLLCLSQDFMRLWMGESMMLGTHTIVMMCLYFYVLKMGDMKTMYSSANGLWWKHKYRSIAETIFNVLLNVILGKLFGIDGIVVATIISLLICNFFWASYIVFDSYFKGSLIIKYFKYHFKYLIFTAIISCITFLICNRISVGNALESLLLKGMVCLIIPTVLYFAIYSRTRIWKVSLSTVKSK